MLKVGLTGGIASGKNTVSRIFEGLGAKIIDADKISREVMKRGEVVYEKVVSHFGTGILRENGEIDRGKLAQIIFSDPKEREALNGITHPEIIKIEDRLCEDIIQKDPSSIIIVNAALLIEAGVFRRFDKLILIYASTETQIDRLIKRDGLERNEALMRINSQMPFEEKRGFADYIIDNDGPLERTRTICEEVYRDLLHFSAEKDDDPGGSEKS